MVQSGVAVVAAAGLVGAVAVAANWRLALLAALAALAIAATRVRYAPLAAAALVAGVLALAAAGASAGTDQRPAAAAQRCADVIAGTRRASALRARGVSCAQARGVARAWLRADRQRARIAGFHCRGQQRLRCRRDAARLSATVVRGGRR